MARRVRLTILCEDKQHEAFLRRFLKRKGWDNRTFRVERAPSGRGAGEQFVRARFPAEIKQCRGGGNVGLVVMLDGDRFGVETRLDSLDEACLAKQIQPRGDEDRVVVFVPTRNIETWLAYLAGETVDEESNDYLRLPREGDCDKHVQELVRMCERGNLREPAPPSLAAACTEYWARLANWD